MAWTASAAAQDRTQAPAQRAAATVGQMTLDEKLSLVHGYFGATLKGAPPAPMMSKMLAMEEKHSSVLSSSPSIFMR